MNEDPLPLLSFSCQAELREENPECRVEGASAQVEEFEVLLGHHLPLTTQVLPLYAIFHCRFLKYTTVKSRTGVKTGDIPSTAQSGLV